MTRLQPWLLACALVLWAGSPALADIRSPQDHPDVEIQPHLVIQWHDEPLWDDDGIGVGVHVGIPIVSRGPITTINNSLAIGFGLDWAYFDSYCGRFALDPREDCSANDFWLPVYLQWNFYFSDLISAFPALGLAIEYETWDGVVCAGGRGPDWYWCDDDGSDLDVEPVLWLGVRFHVATALAITLQLGTPSLLLGVSVFM
jgi:hypothetical protein